MLTANLTLSLFQQFHVEYEVQYKEIKSMLYRKCTK